MAIGDLVALADRDGRRLRAADECGGGKKAGREEGKRAEFFHGGADGSGKVAAGEMVMT